MILVHTTIPLDPRREDELLGHIDDLVEHSRNEDGTVRYRALRDLTDPDLIRFVEQYEDADSAEAHTESEVYRRFVETLPDVVEGEIETVQYEIDDVAVAEFTAEEAVAALD
jgi:quinol monooxygenase YgiN